MEKTIEWCNERIASLIDEIDRVTDQRDNVTNALMHAVESLNANVMARRNAHPRGCCDWSCDLCAPLLVLDGANN